MPSSPNEPPFSAPGPATLFEADAIAVAAARKASAAALGPCNADAGAAALLASADLWAALESFTGSEEHYSETRWAMLPNVDDVSWNALLRFQWSELAAATGRAEAAAKRLAQALSGIDATGCRHKPAGDGAEAAAPGLSTSGTTTTTTTAARAQRHSRAVSALVRAAELAVLYQGTWSCLLETTWWVRTARVVSLSHGDRALGLAMPLPQSVLAPVAEDADEVEDFLQTGADTLRRHGSNKTSPKEAGRRHSDRRRRQRTKAKQHHKARPVDPDPQQATGSCLSWPWLRGQLDGASAPPVQRLSKEAPSHGRKPTDRACAEASRLLAASRGAVQAWKRTYPGEGAMWGITAPATGTDARPSLFRDTAPMSARSVIEWLNGPLRWRWRALCEKPASSPAP
jgi:hypothetical protein